ncbi:aminotransferase class IV [Streptomyces sp. NPDC101490]|uniref:aminotransferase class IV n=1 Tax=Streptomyces sp. NPDC101490 TaxID=3366143 RepID=UPI0038137FCD
MSNELVVTPTATPRPRPEADGPATPVLTDHAFFMRSGKRRTWQGLTVADRDAVPALRPTAGAVLAGQSVVDTFTAYRTADGPIAVFRPDSHLKRLNNGARRLALPQVDFDRVWTAVRALVELDREWIPAGPGGALHLRAVLAADGTGLTPGPADACLFYVLASVADPAAAGRPVRAMTLDGYVRAWPGGTGDVNDAGSLAAAVVPGEVAANYGYDHVLWLDGPQGRFVQQIGNLNAFFVIDGVLTTPALDRTVLPGVTRDSVVKLARDAGTRVVERPVELAEVLKGIADGTVTECFATGGGAGIAPVTSLGHQGEEHRFAAGETGPVTARFRGLLDGVHRGEAVDRFGWMRRLTEVAPVHA